MIRKLFQLSFLRKTHTEIWILYICTLETFSLIGLCDAFCQAGNLLPGVRIVGSCGFLPGEVCKAKCEFNGKTIWRNQVQCLRTQKWSPMPYCQNAPVVKALELVDCGKLPIDVQGKAFCLKISKKLTRKNMCPDLVNLKMSMHSCPREPNSDCIVSCGGNYATLRCLPNGKWSHTPSCLGSNKKVCPDPEIGRLVNCSRREGDRCKIRCPNGKIMSEDIICLASGKWSIAPTSYSDIESLEHLAKKATKLSVISKCTCPPPKVTDAFMKTGDCDDKRIGEKCNLKCKKNFSIIGKRVIECLKNASWSSLPVCSNKTCPVPDLPDSLIFNEDCSQKLPAQRCNVKCKGRSQLLERRPFTCLNGTHWSKFPQCACVPPELPDGMATAEDCQTKKIGKTCRLKCTGKYAITGMTFITCQSDGNWTSFPRCHRNSCTEPSLPETSMLKENCSSKKIGETCKFECLKVTETYEISCINGTHWSSFLKCSCPTPSLSSKIEIKEDCSLKKPRQKCKISCKGFKNHHFLTCRNNSLWSEEPPCDKEVCPRPVLPSHLETDEDCSYKGDGDKCNLICTKGGNVVGEKSIKCMKGKRWSRFPTCTCPSPQTREDLEIMEDCSNKKPGNRCKVKCSAPMSDNKSIICRNDSTWSPYPTCSNKTCSEPELPTFISIEGDCTTKSVGKVCEVTCKKGGTIIGSNKITCLDTLKWSVLPSCTCAEPKLSGNFLKSDCEDKGPGDKCKLSCKEGFKLIGKEYIRCLNNTKWSPLPKCENKLCPTPKLKGILDFAENCSNKRPSQTCELVCKEGGNIIGKKNIKCLKNLKWTDLPSCTCPTPKLNNDLQTNSSCNNITISEKCYLNCKENFSNPTFPYIECMNTSKWSSQPSCEKEYCQKPNIPPIMVFDGICSLKVPGDTCSISCREEGVIIGKNELKCVNLTAWTKLPDCGCLPPLLGEDLQTEGECIKKKPKEKCNLKCKAGKKLVGNSFITCQKNFRWTSQPECSIPKCADPLLPKGILGFKRQCSFNTIGDSCTVRCIEGGNIIGSDTIKCINETHWSDFPECTCPAPSLSEDLLSKEDCSNKKKTETCRLRCKGSKKLTGNDSIMCDENTNWSSQPQCKTVFCPKPNLRRGILISKEDCSSKAPDESCELTCEKGGNIIGSNFIKCENGKKWSKFPECTCPPPSLHRELKTKENCNSKKINEKCEVACTGIGMDEGKQMFITCRNTTTWSRIPRCKSTFCPTLSIPRDVFQTKENCDSKIPTEKCDLICKQGGSFIGDSFVECLSGGTWSPLPDCTCPDPNLGNFLVKREDCSLKKRSEKCKLSCIDSKKSPEYDFIACRSDTKWSQLPRCRDKFCPVPNIPPSLQFATDCSSVPPGEGCLVRCTEGGNIIGDKLLSCSRGLTWSRFPFCTCPEPKGIGVNSQNCINVRPGGSCTLSCIDRLSIISQNFITCSADTKWSTIPNCGKMRCPNFSFPTVAPYEGTCVNVSAGGQCFVRCKEGRRVINNKNFIECGKNGNWMNSPECSCQPLALPPIYKFEADCSAIRPGSACIVYCEVENERKGPFSIMCSRESKWGFTPGCEVLSCPSPPVLKGRQIYKENCKTKLLGQKCLIGCQGIPGGINVTCVMRQSETWTQAPPCPSECQRPTWMSKRGLIFIEQACLKEDAIFYQKSSCKLSCGNGGLLMRGEDTITCLPDNSWTQFPECSCPPPKLASNVATAENCTARFINYKCFLVCAKGFSFSSINFIVCKGVEWETAPTCQPVSRCGRPQLTDPLMEWTENCDTKLEGELCRMKCKGNAPFIKTNNPNIKCVRGPAGLVWSVLPTCACISVTTVGNFQVTQPCDQKRPGETCLIWCIQEKKYVTTVCQSQGNWLKPPC